MTTTYTAGTQVDHYEIIRKLGHGGMNRVYLARDASNQQEVVLKFPNDDLIGNIAVFERYKREAEIGNRSTRPELAKALEAARKGKATLLIAKLDRLARNLVFIANLMDAGVDFVACDQPFASRLTLPILAAVAEDEVRRISERTKAALQAAKARGVKLGSPIAVETVVAARAARSRYSANANATTRAVIADIQRSGVSTLLEIGKALEARGVRTPRGHTTL